MQNGGVIPGAAASPLQSVPSGVSRTGKCGRFCPQQHLHFKSGSTCWIHSFLGVDCTDAWHEALIIAGGSAP